MTQKIVGFNSMIVNEATLKIAAQMWLDSMLTVPGLMKVLSVKHKDGCEFEIALEGNVTLNERPRSLSPVGP